MKAIAVKKCLRDCPWHYKRVDPVGLIDPNQCVFAVGEPFDWEPGRTCPLPDIPIPHGTERMQAIQWKKAWDFIKALAPFEKDKGDVPVISEEGFSNENEPFPKTKGDKT